jgi:hypothetical protein
MEKNIIKKIPNIKLDRNLLIYDYNENIDFLKKYKLNKWLKYKLDHAMQIYKVYYGDIYNPPFFNNIICLKNNLSLEELQQLWNMTYFNGYILINHTKHDHLFKKSIIENNNNMILIKKNIFITYSFPKYRILDFIIAGTMKGGTTAGITNFSKHPDISMVKNEIHYFDKKDEYQKGIEWYKSHFDYKKKMVGDKAPDVMYMTSCLELLQLINPHVKIILFLRNPIDRAYSHWKMTRDIFGNKKSFEDCVNDEIDNKMGENRVYKIAFWTHFVQRGLYYQQIEEILKWFSKDNLYISISEKIRSNMDDEYQKIFKFLGVNEFHIKFEEDFVSKSKDTIDKNSSIYKKLVKIYNPDIKKLEKFLGYKMEWW